MRAFFDGGISSVGRALDCDSRCHRFDPGMSPQYYEKPADSSAGFFVHRCQSLFRLQELPRGDSIDNSI